MGGRKREEKGRWEKKRGWEVVARRTLIIYNKMPLQHPAEGSDSKTSTAISYSPISSLISFPLCTSGARALLSQVFSTSAGTLAARLSASPPVAACRRGQGKTYRRVMPGWGGARGGGRGARGTELVAEERR